MTVNPSCHQTLVIVTLVKVRVTDGTDFLCRGHLQEMGGKEDSFIYQYFI